MVIEVPKEATALLGKEPLLPTISEAVHAEVAYYLTTRMHPLLPGSTGLTGIDA